MTQTVRVEFIRGNEFHLTDGTIIIANALLYCTGYKLSFPFLDEACQIKVNNDHVEALFKHLINVKHPKMAIVGIPFRIIPFPLFHIQVNFLINFGSTVYIYIYIKKSFKFLNGFLIPNFEAQS